MWCIRFWLYHCFQYWEYARSWQRDNLESISHGIISHEIQCFLKDKFRTLKGLENIFSFKGSILQPKKFFFWRLDAILHLHLPFKETYHEVLQKHFNGSYKQLLHITKSNQYISIHGQQWLKFLYLTINTLLGQQELVGQSTSPLVPQVHSSTHYLQAIHKWNLKFVTVSPQRQHATNLSELVIPHTYIKTPV